MIIESGSCAIKEIFKGKIKGHNRKDNPVPSCIMMGGHFRSVLWVAQATDRTGSDLPSHCMVAWDCPF